VIHIEAPKSVHERIARCDSSKTEPPCEKVKIASSRQSAGLKVCEHMTFGNSGQGDSSSCRSIGSHVRSCSSSLSRTLDWIGVDLIGETGKEPGVEPPRHTRRCNGAGKKAEMGDIGQSICARITWPESAKDALPPSSRAQLRLPAHAQRMSPKLRNGPHAATVSVTSP
jgi:hypothetical protein